MFSEFPFCLVFISFLFSSFSAHSLPHVFFFCCLQMQKLRTSSKGKGDPPEQHRNLSLVSLPPTLPFETLTAVSFDSNQLDHSHLEELFSKALLLAECSFKSNRVVKVPRSILKLKKLQVLHLDDNPIGWPRPPPAKRLGDWKRAVQDEPLGRRVFRIYDEDPVGELQWFTDVEIVCMGDPMFKDKDEDRADVRFGGCRWAPAGKDEDDPEELYTLPFHNRGKKNKFGDADQSYSPWYRVELPGPERVYPAEFLSVSVMDGHGGFWVAEALKQNLLRKLMHVGVVDKDLPDNYQGLRKKCCCCVCLLNIFFFFFFGLLFRNHYFFIQID